MEVRHATPDDARAVQRVAARSARAAYEPILDDHALVDYVERDRAVAELADWLAEAEGREDVRYLVAVDGPGDRTDGVVGFAQLRWDDGVSATYVDEDDCLLQSLYVDPDRWGDGAGTALVDRGVADLPDRLSRVVLGVLPDNEVGKSFYAGYGFERVGEDVFEVGDAAYPIDVLALRLPPGDAGDPP